MSKQVVPCPVPVDCQLAPLLHNADFHGAYRLPDPLPQASALESWLALSARTPAWMNGLMALRNRAVRLVGLKHLGDSLQARSAKPAAAYRVGDRVGIFTLEALSEQEVVLGDDDKHLHVRLSLRKQRIEGRALLTLSTVVHNHNRLGRVYMAVVGPVHSLIVPLMLRQVSHVD